MDGDRPPALTGLTAPELHARMARGEVTATAVAKAFLDVVAAREEQVQAWAWFDPGFVLHQAEALDRHRQAGRPIGALHGLPVGVKDIIDTAKIPTENGTALDRGRVPSADAAVVARLKAAGAVIMGKTRTTELAAFSPGPTTNPAAPGHTPGGSSSGSAAAVAAGMVPLAIGTQTAGSVIRPAAFCGVTGFKPTFGLIPRTGILTQSPSLDTVGTFAADPLGAALLADALAGHDAGDPATAPAAPPRLAATCAEPPPLPPVFAFVRPPGWDEAEPDTRDAFAELVAALGEDRVFEVELPAVFADAHLLRERVNLAEMAHTCRRYARGAAQLAPQTRALLEKGAAISAADYLAARDWMAVLAAGLAPIFERCDAILTPAAPGPAPAGLEATGSPIFNGLWTMTGVPCVTLPLLTSSAGLPMGVQLVGPRQGDGRLLRTARWLTAWAQEGEE